MVTINNKSNYSLSWLGKIKNYLYKKIYYKSFESNTYKFIYNLISSSKSLENHMQIPDFLKKDGDILLNIINDNKKDS